MSLAASRAQLARRTKELNVSWEQTKNYWRDAKAREFESKYIASLPDAVNASVTIIEELDKILNKIRKDCE